MIYPGAKTVTVSGTPEPLCGNGLSGRVRIRAFSSNNGDIYIGGAPTTPYFAAEDVISAGPQAAAKEGWPLAAGEWYPFDDLDAGNIWIDADTAGEGVSFMVLPGRATIPARGR